MRAYGEIITDLKRVFMNSVYGFEDSAKEYENVLLFDKVVKELEEALTYSGAETKNGVQRGIMPDKRGVTTGPIGFKVG